MSGTIHFWLNDQEIKTDMPGGMLVLDYLRHHLRQTGTKEGCKEGDCGACTVLIGELRGTEIEYRPVTSCLMPVGELHGRHLVTIEGLNREHLTIVQDAIVREGASQCGFCTPGIVVSLTAELIEHGGQINRERIKYALSGNLCRCTGYASLLRAGEHIAAAAQKISGSNGQFGRIQAMVAANILPEYFLEMPARLAGIKPIKKLETDQTVFIAGGTDLYVQQGDDLPDTAIMPLNLLPEMRGVTEKDDRIEIGPLTTFEDLGHDPVLQKYIPELPDFMLRNASWQIRNRATVGGNIVNASPIGDVTNLLLVLNAQLRLSTKNKSREVPLSRFYKGYKQIDLQPGEMITAITLPRPAVTAKINFEKVSKREYLDIASVNSSIYLDVDGDTIRQARISLGGVAPIPLLLQEATKQMAGQPLRHETVFKALETMQQEIAPISDIRGSAEYKRLLARNLVIAHVVKLFPEHFTLEMFEGVLFGE